MQYTKLGKTNLNVSVAGLGCGGRSRLGLRMGLGEENAIKIVRKALDLGVTFFDTAAVYKTEEALGKGLLGVKRDNYVISSKFSPSHFGSTLLEEGSLMKSLDNSLIALQLDYIDVFLLHGVWFEHYEEARDRFVPELIKAQEQGKIRFTGVTEVFNDDTSHLMESLAVNDTIWDVIMVGYNLLNSSARKNILPLAIKNNIGTLNMFAVRTALSNNKRLLEIIDDLQKCGIINKNLLTSGNPLDFLTKNNEASSIMEAAYRFCRHSKGIDVVLTGTSSVDHLIENIASILSPSLTNTTINKIIEIFGDVDSISGQ